MHRHRAHRYVAQYGTWNSLGYLGDSISWYPRQATRRASPHGHYTYPILSRVNTSRRPKTNLQTGSADVTAMDLKSFHSLILIIFCVSPNIVCGAGHNQDFEANFFKFVGDIAHAFHTAVCEFTCPPGELYDIDKSIAKNNGTKNNKPLTMCMASLTLIFTRSHYDNLLSALDSRNGVMSMRTSPHLRALLINSNPCGQQFS